LPHVQTRKAVEWVWGIWVWRKDSASVMGGPDQGVLASQVCGGVSGAWDQVCLEGVGDTTGPFRGRWVGLW
jgi:hypothetical protein